MNNNSKRKPEKFLALIICLNLVIALAVVGTVAYIFTSSETVTNTFTPVTPGSDIDETFDGETKKDVTVKNTGKVDSYIRVKVVITWQDGNGNVYPEVPIRNTDYTISYGSDWTLAADGFWYYKSSVTAGSSTTDLIDEAKQIKACTNPDYTLHIEILSQAVQSIPSTAVVELWKTDTNNLTVNSDGTLSVTVKATTDNSGTESY